MTTRPSAAQIRAMAEVAGTPVSEETAQRISGAIGPALEGFTTVSGSMGMDLEPATFLMVQRAGVK